MRRFSITLALSTLLLVSVSSGQQSATARVLMLPRFEPAACPALPVPAENSESGGKFLVFGFTDAISPACLSLCDRSFLGLDADSVVWR
jgi:hypothetical protein